jgi:hypothetical protein
VSKVVYSIPVDSCLGNVKIVSKDMYDKGIEEPVDEFGKQFFSFVEI